MIVRDTPSKIDLLFAVRGSIVPVIAPRVVFLMAMAAVMVALHSVQCYVNILLAKQCMHLIFQLPAA